MLLALAGSISRLLFFDLSAPSSNNFQAELTPAGACLENLTWEPNLLSESYTIKKLVAIRGYYINISSAIETI